MLIITLLKRLKTMPIVGAQFSISLLLNRVSRRLSQILTVIDNALESTYHAITAGIVINNEGAKLLKTLLKTPEFSTIKVLTTC